MRSFARCGWARAALLAIPLSSCRAKTERRSPSVVAKTTPVASVGSRRAPVEALPDPSWRRPRDPNQEAELARDASKLQALRSVPPGARLGCAQFRSLELAAARARGEDQANDCSDKATKLVTCLETPTGFFVPVAQYEGICGYRMWFVPRASEQPTVPVSARLEEFDLAFTLQLFAEDVDNDGVVEAVLVRGSEHPEGVGEGQSTSVLKPNGAELDLPFSDFRDFDKDGRVDVVLDFGDLTNGAGCERPEAFEAWVERRLYGPRVFMHRLQGFTFSLNDQVAREARAKDCEKLGSNVVARRNGAIDESETLRRAVCRLANGEDPVALGQALEQACRRDFEMPTDCKKARPGVCFWRRNLLGLPAAFEALKPWLAPHT